MKRLFLFLLPATLLLSACCTKKYCSEESRVHFSLHGFTLSEVDTIYTTGYAMGSNFTQVIKPQLADTVREVYNEHGTYAFAPMDASMVKSDGLSDAMEWKVYIPSVNRTLLINNYGYSTFKCNSCFPVSPHENKMRSLSTCSVNGVTTYVNDVKMQK